MSDMNEYKKRSEKIKKVMIKKMAEETVYSYIDILWVYGNRKSISSDIIFFGLHTVNIYIEMQNRKIL